ncbi:MAG: hypothetical protein MRY49_02835 [Candidatus Pacebacteria bacterium]|nr:hypothetical protein [Candidatus Paceibacterota bacterium]
MTMLSSTRATGVETSEKKGRRKGSKKKELLDPLKAPKRRGADMIRQEGSVKFEHIMPIFGFPMATLPQESVAGQGAVLMLQDKSVKLPIEVNVRVVRRTNKRPDIAPHYMVSLI